MAAEEEFHDMDGGSKKGVRQHKLKPPRCSLGFRPPSPQPLNVAIGGPRDRQALSGQ